MLVDKIFFIYKGEKVRHGKVKYVSQVTELAHD